MELNNCRLCSSSKVIKLFSFRDSLIRIWPSQDANKTNFKSDLKLFVCSICGHFQLQNLSQEFIKTLYEGEYFNLESNEINKERSDFIKKFGLKVNEKILDVGGGTNSSDRFFCEQQYSVLDPQKPTNKNVIHIRGLISDSTLQKNHYDYIFAFHVIEHLNQPFEDILKLRDALKAGGKFFLEVPDAVFFAKNIPHYLYFFQHINIFTIPTITLMLERTGFRTVNIENKNGRILIAAEKIMEKSINEISIPKNINTDFIMPTPEFFEKLDTELVRQISAFEYKEISLLGCGGSAALLINRCPSLTKLITSYYDSDVRKIDKFMPGTKLAIKDLPKNLNKNILWLTLDSSLVTSKYSSLNVNVIDLTLIIRKLQNNE
jgi:SAM-dependent methyltransferase